MTNNILRAQGFSTLLDPRLEERYSMLISEHLTVMPKLAQGVKALSHLKTTFANTQAAWRFLNNENVSFQEISRPLFQAAAQELSASTGNYGLVMHDWCRVNYYGHEAKKDKREMTSQYDVGYELYASLLISSEAGQVISPLNLELLTQDGRYTFEHDAPIAEIEHLEQLVEATRKLDAINLGKPLVHIIDREADSASHLRQMCHTKWLTRVKSTNTLQHEGSYINAKNLASKLEGRFAGKVSYKGQEAFRYIAETRVKLIRKSEEKTQKDAPEVRFIYCSIVDEEGKELANWYLLSNVMTEPAETLALWYYWRWSVESWFKVLKGHGFQLEEWQQQTGEAIYRRLIVSSMACVLAWKLYKDESPEAETFKGILIKFSGRLTKKKKPVTFPALLAGLWVYLQIQEFFESYSPEEIESFMDFGRTFFGHSV